MTITEFLLARIAEDEAAAYKDQPWKWTTDDGRPLEDGDAAYFTSQFDTMAMEVPVKRWLVECEAKRQILALRDRPEYVFRLLTLPYVDHPDYDEEWRP